MSNSLFLSFLLGQFIGQTALYFIVRKYVISKYFKNSSKLPLIMTITNLGISFLVLVFTKAGSISGVTNLAASVLLGFIMAIDCYILKSRNKKQKENDPLWFM